MKLLYASLAAMAAADIVDQFYDLLESVYKDHGDGHFEVNLSPYYTLSSVESYDADDNWTLCTSEAFSYYGDKDNMMSRSVTIVQNENSYSYSDFMSGDYDQVPQDLWDFYSYLGVPDFSVDGQYSSFNSGVTYDLSMSESGGKLVEQGFINNDNGAAQVKWDAVYSADIEIEEDYVTAIVDLEYSTTNDGFDQDYYLDYFNADGKIEVEVGLNVEECGNYFTALGEAQQAMRGIVCDIEADVDIALSHRRDSVIIAIDNEVNMSGVKLSGTSTITHNDGEIVTSTVFVRGEDKKDKPELLSTGNFYALYFHEGNAQATRSRMQSDEATLIWRMPGYATYENDLYPIIEEKIIYVAMDFFDKLMSDSDKIPHLITYFDRLLASKKLKKNFDFSKFMKKARFDTDLSEHEDFNQWLQDEAEALNHDLVENVFNCEEMKQVFTDSREYLHDLTDKKVGQKVFDDTWGIMFEN